MTATSPTASLAWGRLSRYLSPEPLLQSPAYLRRMAQNGTSVPTYAYAANNPVRYIDSDGRRFRNPTSNERRAINNLMKNSDIGERVRYLNSTNDVLIDLRDAPGLKDTLSAIKLGKPGGGCVAATPTTMTLRYDRKYSARRLRDEFGLPELTLEQLLAHELGHLDYELEAAANGDPIDNWWDNFRAVRWENYVRDPYTQRPMHEPE